MRNYDDIVRRVEGLSRPHVQRRVLGDVEGYPVFGVTLSSGLELPTALIIGGTHGDEPAGVEAALAFLSQDQGTWLDALRFEVIPCFNPYGYVHNTRHNRQDVDINWAFLRDDVPEVGILRRLIEGRRFEAVIDLHEDWESPGYYLYELRRGAALIGPDLVRRVSAVCPVNTNPCIEGAEARAGVVYPDLDAEVARRGEGIPIALFNRYTDHLLTSETPTGEAMERRVRAHLIALETVIETHVRRQTADGRRQTADVKKERIP
jgi:hypothetical protein